MSTAILGMRFTLGMLESLEPRRCMTGDWQNSLRALDVDTSGLVSPIDALLVINELTLDQTSELPVRPHGSTQPYVDVNGDDWLSPLDALLVVNALNRFGSRSLELAVGLTPASDPNGNGVVLTTDVTIAGQTLAETLVTVATSGEPSVVLSTTTSDAEGRFLASANLKVGKSELLIRAVDPLGRAVESATSVRVGDVVLDWNAAALNVIREWSTTSNDPYLDRIVTAQPPVVARNLAMLHLAMFEAMNSIQPAYTSYLPGLSSAPEGASPIAAAAAAAHTVATTVYREADELAAFQATLAESLGTVPDGEAKTLGLSFGRAVGQAILASRVGDGSTSPWKYTPGSDTGDWNRTYPDYLPPLLPQWPNVKPFAMTTGRQFRPEAPPQLNTLEYATAVDEVMRLGRWDSVERTQEQTQIALFWADGGGTFTPPGHWNQIAADVVIDQSRPTLDNGRLFALLNVALADAGITAWDAKYEYNLWRPIDAVRNADRDDNSATTADRYWIPLLKTPPFPTYTSGHSTFSGAAARVLSALLGSRVPFESRADGHDGPSQRPIDTSLIATRKFASFDDAAEEAGRSRIYGGIHFEFDNTSGLASGRAVGEWALETLLKPLVSHQAVSST